MKLGSSEVSALYLGGSEVEKVYKGSTEVFSAAPSGIPVATTSAVIVSNSSGFNGQYDKLELTLWSDGGNNILVWDSPDAAIPNRWSLVNQETNFIITHQTWSDQTQIPMSGWPSGETITAA